MLRRTKRSKGCLTRNGMLHMMFKLGQCAEEENKAKRTSDLIGLDTMLQEQPREDIVKILNILILQLD